MRHWLAILAILPVALAPRASAARPRSIDSRSVAARTLSSNQRTHAPEARDLFGRAVRAFAGHRYEEALELFSASRRLRETATVVFNIAACQRELGQNIEALASYSQFLELRGERATDRDRAEVAAARIVLISKVATITLRTNVAEARVLMNGQPLPGELLVDPGTEVVFEATAPGYLSDRVRRRPEQPGPLTVDLRLEPAQVAPGPVAGVPEPLARPIAPRHERRVGSSAGMPTWVWLAIGAAVVGTGVGVTAALGQVAEPPALRVTGP